MIIWREPFDNKVTLNNEINCIVIISKPPLTHEVMKLINNI